MRERVVSALLEMIQAKPPAGDEHTAKRSELDEADVRGMYDTMRVALMRAHLAAEGRPKQTVHAILERGGVRVVTTPTSVVECAYRPRADACVVRVRTAAMSARADMLLMQWNALMFDVEREVFARLDAAGFPEDRFLVASGNGPLGLWMVDLLGLTDDETALVEGVFAGRSAARVPDRS